jgi:hypothetical protein
VAGSLEDPSVVYAVPQMVPEAFQLLESEIVSACDSSVAYWISAVLVVVLITESSAELPHLVDTSGVADLGYVDGAVVNDETRVARARPTRGAVAGAGPGVGGHHGREVLVPVARAVVIQPMDDFPASSGMPCVHRTTPLSPSF